MTAACTGVFHHWPADTESSEISFRCWPLISVRADCTYMNCSALQNCAEVGGGVKVRPSAAETHATCAGRRSHKLHFGLFI